MQSGNRWINSFMIVQQLIFDVEKVPASFRKASKLSMAAAVLSMPSIL